MYAFKDVEFLTRLSRERRGPVRKIQAPILAGLDATLRKNAYLIRSPPVIPATLVVGLGG